MPETLENKETFKVDEQIVDIPSVNVDAFLKKYPQAKKMESFLIGKDTVDIPQENVGKFKEKYPDAKSLYNDVPEEPKISYDPRNFESFPKELLSNINPTRDTKPFVSMVDGTEEEQKKSEDALTKKLSLSTLLSPEEQKQHNFNQTTQGVWRAGLTNPDLKDEKVRDQFYKMVGKDYDKDQLEKIKKVGDEAANIQTNYEQAREYMHDNPDNPEAIANMGGWQAAAGDHELANKTFTYLMSKYPDKPYGYTGNAYLSYLHGDTKGAIQLTTQELTRNPDDVTALNERAKYLSMEGLNDQAIVDADKAVKNAKFGTNEAITAYMTRANVYSGLGKKDLAEQDIQTAGAMQKAIDKKEKTDEFQEKNFGDNVKIVDRALPNFKIPGSKEPVSKLSENTPVLNEDGSVTYMKDGKTETISADEVKQIKEGQVASAGEEAKKEASPIGKLGFWGLDYLTSIPKDISEGGQKLARSYADAINNPLNWKKNIVDELSGGVQAATGVLKALPSSAVNMALWTGGTEAATNIAEKVKDKGVIGEGVHGVVGALTDPYGTIRKQVTDKPEGETEQEIQGLVDNIAFILEAHGTAKVGTSAIRTLGNVNITNVSEGIKSELSPYTSVEITDKKGNLIFKKDATENVPKEQYVNNGLAEYQEKNKKFLDGLKKSNITTYNSILNGVKKRLENEYKPVVSDEQLKSTGVADKIVSKEPLRVDDIVTTEKVVKEAAPEKVKEAAEKVVPKEPEEKGQIVSKEVTPEKEEPNALDKANTDLTRLQERLKKAADKSKPRIQKQIDAKIQEIEGLKNKPVEESGEKNYIPDKLKTQTVTPSNPETINDIPLKDIDLHPKVRHIVENEINKGKVSKKGDTPISLKYNNDGTLQLMDGAHRFIQAEREGKKTINGLVFNVDQDYETFIPKEKGQIVSKEEPTVIPPEVSADGTINDKDIPAIKEAQKTGKKKVVKLSKGAKKVYDLSIKAYENTDEAGKQKMINGLAANLESGYSDKKYDAYNRQDYIDAATEFLKTIKKKPIEEPVITRNPNFKKGEFTQGNETDIQFSHDITQKGTHILAPLGEPHYTNEGLRNEKNFDGLGAKRSRAGLKRDISGNLIPEEITLSDNAHSGSAVVNSRNEVSQGDGRTQRLQDYDRQNDPEGYYQNLKKNKKELGFTDEQIDEAQKKGWVHQRMINVDDNRMAQLSQTDARDLIKHDAADIAAKKLLTLTPDQTEEFAHLFDGRPLEDILQQNGRQIISSLNKAGIISDLTEQRLLIGSGKTATLNPEFIPHLKDVFRGVITSDLNDPVPLREYYNNAPEIIKNSLDRIIPDILKLPSDKRPLEYFQKALAVLGNKGDIPTREFVNNLQNASELDKAFIPFVLDPVSIHTIPNLMKDYKLELDGSEYDGIKPKSKSQAMEALFYETDNNKLNGQEEELDSRTTTEPDKPNTPGKANGKDISQETYDTRSEGQKIADKIFGAIPQTELIKDLPDNLNVTENNMLGNIIPFMRGTFRRVFKLDGRDAAHVIGSYHNDRTGTDKAMNVYAVQTLKALTEADPETLKYDNTSKVYKYFDQVEQAQALGKEAPEFKADNNAQQVLYDFTNSIKDRTKQLTDELQDVQGLPDSYIELIHANMQGFLHRILGEHYEPIEIIKDREKREAEIQAYKEGRKDLKDIGGVRGLFQQTMAEEQVKPIYRGFLGNSDYDLFEPRKTLEAVDKNGNKNIIEFQDGNKIVKWKNGKSSPFGEYNQTQGGNGSISAIREANVLTDKDENTYTFNDGLVSDIRKETGKNYLENPVLSSIETLKNLNKIHATVKFFQAIKNSPQVAKFMKVLDKNQINTLESIKSASLKEDSNVSLTDLIDNYNTKAAGSSKPLIEYSDTDTPNDLTNKLLQAHNLPDNFLNEFQAAKGTINHPIFDNTWFRKDGLKTIQNALMNDKPKDDELIRSYLNWIYLSIEGTGHALNLAINTAINAGAEVLGGNFKGLGKSFTLAEKAIREQDDLHKYFVSHGVANFFNVSPDYTEAVINILKQNIADNSEKNKPLQEAIANMAGDYKEGFQDLKNISQKINRGLIWWMNDMNAYSTILKEASNQGLDINNIDFNNQKHTDILDNAIKVSAKNYNSYHIASEELVGGRAGRAIANVLRNRGVFIFTNYLVGNIKMLYGQVQQTFEGYNKNADENQVRRANTAVDRLVVGVAMLYGIAQIEKMRNQDRKKGDFYHEENRPGILRIPYEVERRAKGQINTGELLTKIIHPMPLLMRMPNWFTNSNGMGGTNDPNGTIFSWDATKYLLNGATVPRVNQQTSDNFYENYIKPRIGLEYDVKLTPDQHGLVTQLRNYNDYIRPEMSKIVQSLQNQERIKNAGGTLKPEDQIDEVAAKEFLTKCYYANNNLLDHYENYLNASISSATDENQRRIYEDKLKNVEELKKRDVEAWKGYQEGRIKSIQEGEFLKEQSKVIQIN